MLCVFGVCVGVYVSGWVVCFVCGIYVPCVLVGCMCMYGVCVLCEVLVCCLLNMCCVFV